MVMVLVGANPISVAALKAAATNSSVDVVLAAAVVATAAAVLSSFSFVAAAVDTAGSKILIFPFCRSFSATSRGICSFIVRVVRSGSQLGSRMITSRSAGMMAREQPIKISCVSQRNVPHGSICAKYPNATAMLPRTAGYWTIRLNRRLISRRLGSSSGDGGGVEPLLPWADVSNPLPCENLFLILLLKIGLRGLLWCIREVDE